MTQATTILDDHLDDPAGLCIRSDSEFDDVDRSRLEEFQLAAAARLLARQAHRIPLLAEKLDGRDPAEFDTLERFVDVLFDDGVYKSYDPAVITGAEFGRLTDWLDRLTSHDLSGVDMHGCDSLTEWCRRLDAQADIFVCHSSGTSGVLSFVPRSRRDRDLAVDDVVYRHPSLFTPHERNDVTFFALGPRRLYRITQAVYDGLEQRHHANPVQSLPVFHGPEFHIAQGLLRRAAAAGTPADQLVDPIVAAHGDEVRRFHRDLPDLTQRWTENLVENHRGERVYFQGSFDRAWLLTQYLEQMGLTGAFAPESVFALAGGVKDGSTLPADWSDRFRRATGAGADNLASTWGMSEITGGVPRCSAGAHHFRPTIIPFLLEPGTRRPLPRTGARTGQIAVLELNSTDCWGGMITGDRGTVEWDRSCACSRPGPLLDPSSIARLP